MSDPTNFSAPMSRGAENHPSRPSVPPREAEASEPAGLRPPTRPAGDLPGAPIRAEVMAPVFTLLIVAAVAFIGMPIETAFPIVLGYVLLTISWVMQHRAALRFHVALQRALAELEERSA